MFMSQTEVFIVSPDKCASKRTKERIKQHGPGFTWERTLRPSCFPGVTCAMLVSKTSDWFGWVPIKEIHWQSEEEI